MSAGCPPPAEGPEHAPPYHPWFSEHVLASAPAYQTQFLARPTPASWVSTWQQGPSPEALQPCPSTALSQHGPVRAPSIAGFMP